MITKTKKSLIIILAIFCVAGYTGAHIFSLNASAEGDLFRDDSVYEELLPASALEYTALNAPADACFYDGNYAVIEGQTIRVFFSDGTERLLKGFISLKQIKFLNSETLYASDDGSVYSINLEALQEETDFGDPTFSDLKVREAGGSFFDFNSNYMITVYGSKLIVYNMLDKSIKSEAIETANDVYPIAINGSDEIFYHSGTTAVSMCKRSVNNLSESQEISVTDVRPDKIIANNQYVYYVSSGGIYRLSTNFTSAPQRLALPECVYNLGNLISPTGISFKGDNLLITDSAISAVQEFKPEDGNLIFTGFAIASGKTAYNRIAANATDIERFGNYVAVLDRNKLTVIDVSEGFDTYSKDRFINLFASPSEVKPAYFALGNDSIIYSSDEDANYIASLKNPSDTAPLDFIRYIIKDICYQSGYYYILTTNGMNSYLYKIDEKDFSQCGERREFNGITAEMMTVDVFGNIYIADQTTVYAYKGDATENLSRNGADKIICDLAGVLFAVTGGKICYYDNGWQPYEEIPQDVKTFALSFDKKEIYYLDDNSENVFNTVALGNLAIADITVPQNFLNKEATAEEITLDFYTVHENANKYSVEYGAAKFSYSGLVATENEYIYIESITLADALGKPLTLYALAAQSGVVLVDSAFVTSLQKETSPAPQSAYITTDVNLYRLPVITAADLFAATVDNVTVRLEKGTRVSPVGIVSFLGIDYYAATTEYNGSVYFGFVPVPFTVEVLSQDLIADKYTVEKISAGTLYKDKNMTESILELSDDAEVRLFSEENGVSYVAVAIEGGYITGYIKSSMIKNDAKTAVRNVLIILAVLASVCGTATYFILRKKNEV